MECWGRNDWRQVSATNSAAIPAPVLIKTDAKAISTGSTHTCALLGDTSVVCWGANAAGQLGQPAPVGIAAVAAAVGSATPVGVLGPDGATPLTKVATLASGGGSNCAVTAVTGAVSCWGNNVWGQLANGKAAIGSLDTAVCNGKRCGPISSSGLACDSCEFGESCDSLGQCGTCTPDCIKKNCGDDGCGGSCGACDGPGLACVSHETGDDAAAKFGTKIFRQCLKAFGCGGQCLVQSYEANGVECRCQSEAVADSAALPPCSDIGAKCDAFYFCPNYKEITCLP